MADEVMSTVPDMTFDEAMSLVWEHADGLYEEYTSSPPEMPSIPWPSRHPRADPVRSHPEGCPDRGRASGLDPVAEQEPRRTRIRGVEFT